MDGVRILAALCDPLFENCNLKKLNSLSTLRDKNFMIHGLGTETEKSITSMLDEVNRMKRNFCSVMTPNLVQEKFEEEIGFIKLDEF